MTRNEQIEINQPIRRSGKIKASKLVGCENCNNIVVPNNELACCFNIQSIYVILHKAYVDIGSL